MNIKGRDLVFFELFVMDFAECAHPDSIEEYESLADILHQCVETAITGIIRDDEHIEDPDEYIPSY